MAGKKVKDIVNGILEQFLEDNNLELYNCEFIKEGKDWFLRVFIDKKNCGDDEYVSTDDCETVSRFLSDRLDEEDPIEQNYYLEVSSPGMDRELLRDEHFERYTGRLVDISLYKAVDGTKSVEGILEGLKDGCIVIKDEKGKEIKFPREQVAKTKLAVVF